MTMKPRPYEHRKGETRLATSNVWPACGEEQEKLPSPLFMTRRFELVSDFKPRGDQPRALGEIRRLRARRRYQTLLGVTGSGKTFTAAKVIETLQKPTLVHRPNKTLAAQLYGEFKELFPQNAVEYFVSYYDYYQPEAYVPSSDTYIEKDSIINDADRPHAPRGDARAPVAAAT